MYFVFVVFFVSVVFFIFVVFFVFVVFLVLRCHCENVRVVTASEGGEWKKTEDHV